MIDFKTFHSLSYGLYIICSELDGKKSGYVGNTGFQVTSEPSTIAISCNKENYTCNIIQQRKAFSLSILQKELNADLIRVFGFKTSSETNKFDNVDYKTGELGLPVVTQYCNAAIECKVINEMDCGSHILFIGEVINAEILNNNQSLTYDYYHSHYKMLAPKNAPTYIDPDKLADKKEEPANSESNSNMSEYICTICGYTYDPAVGDPDNNIPAGTPFEDLPDDYVCPLCGADKDMFNEL